MQCNAREPAPPANHKQLRPHCTDCWGQATHPESKLCTSWGFVPGKNHFKNKFCAECMQTGVLVKADRVRVVLPDTELPGNVTTAGFWNTSTEYEGRFRLMNQNAKCRPPAYILAEEANSEIANAPFLASLPEGFADADGLVRLHVSNGTFVPKDYSAKRRPRKRARPTKGLELTSHLGAELDEEEESGRPHTDAPRLEPLEWDGGRPPTVAACVEPLSAPGGLLSALFGSGGFGGGSVLSPAVSEPYAGGSAPWPTVTWPTVEGGLSPPGAPDQRPPDQRPPDQRLPGFSLPPSPPSTPADVQNCVRKRSASPRSVMGAPKQMHPCTLAFEDHALEVAYRQMAASRMSKVGLRVNASIVMVYIAMLASLYAKADPCERIWPYTVPVLMCISGLASNACVGRLGDPILEHWVLYSVGVAVAGSGSLAFAVFGNSALAALPESCPPQTGAGLYSAVELWTWTPCAFAASFGVSCCAHMLAFPWQARYLMTAISVATVLNLPQLHDEKDLWRQTAIMLLLMAAGEGLGFHFHRQWRLRFFEEQGHAVHVGC